MRVIAQKRQEARANDVGLERAGFGLEAMSMSEKHAPFFILILQPEPA
jgi:hypothetical protein